jgi:hypothetical protein
MHHATPKVNQTLVLVWSHVATGAETTLIPPQTDTFVQLSRFNLSRIIAVASIGVGRGLIQLLKRRTP